MANLKHIALLSAFGLALLPGTALAQASDTQDESAAIPGSFRLSSGISWSRGAYGEAEDTEVLAVPVSLGWRSDAFRVRISVPYVWIDGPGSLISTPEGHDAVGGSDSGQGRGRGGSSSNSGRGSSNSGSGSGGGEIEVEDGDDDEDEQEFASSSFALGALIPPLASGDDDEDEIEDEIEDELEGEFDDDNNVLAPDGVVDSGGFAAGDNQRSGLGDVNIFASYSFDIGGGLYFDPGVKVKLPTASLARRLGTGQVDVTVSGDLVQEVGDVSLYVHGRRKFAGKPAGSTLQDTWGAGAGVSYATASGLSLGADVDWQQSAFTGRPASSEVSGWVNLPLGERMSMTAYAGTGFNANSADLFGGLTVGVRF